MKNGERYKVKSNPQNRRYGVRCYNPTFENDCHLAPGEIGTVVERRWVAGDGSKMSGLWLEFNRGRQKSVDHMDPMDRGQFIRVKGGG
jgi:hypothetical protein